MTNEQAALDAMAAVVREARAACVEAGKYGAIGGDEMVPLQEAIDRLDAIVIPMAIAAMAGESESGEGKR